MSFTTDFIDKLKAIALRIGKLTFTRQKNINLYVDQQLVQLTPIFNDLFGAGQVASDRIVKKKLLNLVETYKVPMKYNKDVINRINGQSVFQGYYDTKYKGVFTRREIDNLKKTILQAKYTGLSEAELSNNIKNTINVTKRRAQLLARTEISRLREATQTIYYEQPGVKKKYSKLFKSEPGARPDHAAYNGQVADANGYFHGPLGSFKFAPIPGQYNCRCKTVFIKKTKEKK